MASMYLRGRIWWGKWSSQDRTVRQSLKTQDKREARRRLRELEAQTAGGERQTTPKETWDTAAADLLTYYQAYGTRDVTEAGYKIKKLTKHFGGTRLATIDASAIAEYVSYRIAQGAANASVNVELMTLRRALGLAVERGKLDRVPVIRTLRPAPPGLGSWSVGRWSWCARHSRQTSPLWLESAACTGGESRAKYWP
jgi:integrase/recombinase XerD